MGNSLQDQLLRAGLVSESQLTAAREPVRGAGAARGERPSEKRGRRRGRGPRGPKKEAAVGAPPSAPPSPPPIELLNAQIRALLDAHRQNDGKAEVPYNFMRENRIKKLYVTETQRRALLGGELAIVGYRRMHHVLPRAVAEQIIGLREEIFVHRAQTEVTPEEDEVPVPDDLVW